MALLFHFVLFRQNLAFVSWFCSIWSSSRRWAVWGVHHFLFISEFLWRGWYTEFGNQGSFINVEINRQTFISHSSWSLIMRFNLYWLCLIHSTSQYALARLTRISFSWNFSVLPYTLYLIYPQRLFITCELLQMTLTSLESGPVYSDVLPGRVLSHTFSWLLHRRLDPALRSSLTLCSTPSNFPF